MEKIIAGCLGIAEIKETKIKVHQSAFKVLQTNNILQKRE